MNPVPVSLCRAMGADLVIAVDLNSDIVGKHLRKPYAPKAAAPSHSVGVGESVLARIQSGIATLGIAGAKTPDNRPSILEVLASSINIMQARITRSRCHRDW